METYPKNRKRLLFAWGVSPPAVSCFPSVALAAGGGADRSADLLDLLYRWITLTLLVIILVVVLREGSESRSTLLQDRREQERTGKELKTQREAPTPVKSGPGNQAESV